MFSPTRSVLPWLRVTDLRHKRANDGEQLGGPTLLQDHLVHRTPQSERIRRKVLSSTSAKGPNRLPSAVQSNSAGRPNLLQLRLARGVIVANRDGDRAAIHTGGLFTELDLFDQRFQLVQICRNHEKWRRTCSLVNKRCHTCSAEIEEHHKPVARPQPKVIHRCKAKQLHVQIMPINMDSACKAIGLHRATLEPGED